MGEGVNAGVDAGADEVGNAVTAALEGAEEVFEAVAFVAGEPGGGDLAGGLIEDLVGEVADEFEPGFEAGEGLDGAVDVVAEVEALEGGVIKLPVGTVEDVAVVDHLGDEADFEGRFRVGEPVAEAGAEEDGLAGIGVGAPFIEDEGAEEVGAVGDFGEEGVGDEVVDGLGDGVAGEEGGEVPAGEDFAAGGAELDGDFGVVAEEGGGEFDEAGFGGGDAEIGEDAAGDPFVDEDAAMLGVLEELDDVPAAVVGFEEVGLGSAAHATEESASLEWHSALN